MKSDESQRSQLPTSDWPEWDWFSSIDKLLQEALDRFQNGKSDCINNLYPFLDSVAESVGSFRLLMLQRKLRDSYVIARVIYEASINACFLLTDPETLAARATTHAKQKSLRNLVREIELAGSEIFKFKAHGAEEILGHPEHKEWLREFTSKSGREITSWTPENVQQRLEAIYLKFGHSDTRGLAFGLLLYRHASEIAHGTLFGTLFSWGAMEPGSPLRSPSDIAVFRQRELLHLLKLVCYSLESLVRIIAPALGIPELSLSARNARTDYYRQREANG